jgi:uncharacterized protein YjbI with pentapeptide repeats
MGNRSDVRLAREGCRALREMRAHKLDLRGESLPGVQLRMANLRESVMSGAYLRGAKFKGANLRGVDLRAADLTYASLRNADLRGADLRGTKLEGADLKGARIDGVVCDSKTFAHVDTRVLRGLDSIRLVQGSTLTTWGWLADSLPRLLSRLRPSSGSQQARQAHLLVPGSTR